MNEWEKAVAGLSDDDWKRIEDLNSRIQTHTGSWGEMITESKTEPGTMVWPYPDEDPLIREFIELWYEKNLVVPFDWGDWQEGRDWYANTDDSKYDTLDYETALKLLTAVIRNDRFNDGAILRSFESGDFPKIINKFTALKGKR